MEILVISLKHETLTAFCVLKSFWCCFLLNTKHANFVTRRNFWSSYGIKATVWKTMPSFLSPWRCNQNTIHDILAKEFLKCCWCFIARLFLADLGGVCLSARLFLADLGGASLRGWTCQDDSWRGFSFSRRSSRGSRRYSVSKVGAF